MRLGIDVLKADVPFRSELCLALVTILRLLFQKGMTLAVGQAGTCRVASGGSCLGEKFEHACARQPDAHQQQMQYILDIGVSRQPLNKQTNKLCPCWQMINRRLLSPADACLHCQTKMCCDQRLQPLKHACRCHCPCQHQWSACQPGGQMEKVLLI